VAVLQLWKGTATGSGNSGECWKRVVRPACVLAFGPEADLASEALHPPYHSLGG